MKTTPVNLGVAIFLGTCVAVVAGGVGYWLHKAENPDAGPAPKVAAAAVPEPEPAAQPDPSPEMSDEDWDTLIAEIEGEPTEAPKVDMEDLEARRQRWENMSLEQRRMLRKAMFSALAKVDGLEEVGEAMREGKIDPRKFSMDPTAIADRLEFHADTMDQEAMEAEVTSALQEMVDQARAQMK